MTREEIIRMAQQVQAEGFAPVGIWPEVRRLCELAYAAGAAAEREACAEVADAHERERCEAWNKVLTIGGEVPSASLSAVAAAIRARGNT